MVKASGLYLSPFPLIEGWAFLLEEEMSSKVKKTLPKHCSGGSPPRMAQRRDQAEGPQSRSFNLGARIPIALYQEHLEDLKGIFTEQAALGLLFIDGSPLSCIAHRYGQQVYTTLLDQIARFLLDLRGVELLSLIHI